MKITIITVTYNSEQFIEKCIQSVLNQTYKNVEYIIIDGKSADDTINIVSKYPDIIKVSEPDEGIYDAVNKGIKISTGDVIGILNSDDFLATKYVLAAIAKYFIDDACLNAVFADIQFISRDHSSIHRRYYSSKKFRPWMFRFGFQPAHPTLYLRKEVF